MTAILDDLPACRETVDEILTLWRSIDEVFPGQGPMPATLADFTNVETDAHVIQDTSDAFDRLVIMHDRKEALLNMTRRFLDHPITQVSLVGGVVLGVAALGHGLSEGYIPANPIHHESIGEAFQKSPIASTLITAIGVGSVAALTNELLDRGYARFTGLSDALTRMQEGADPRSSSLKGRLTLSEREAYSDILHLSYKVASDQDTHTQQSFLQKLHDSMKTVVENLENTPQAGMIQETLNGLRDALASQATRIDPHHEASHQYGAPAGPTL